MLLRRPVQDLANHQTTSERKARLSWEGQLLIWTGDVAGRWKEHPALRGAKSEDFGVDLFISLAEVTEVVKKVLGVELLLPGSERTQSRWFGHLTSDQDASP